MNPYDMYHFMQGNIVAAPWMRDNFKQEGFQPTDLAVNATSVYEHEGQQLLVPNVRWDPASQQRYAVKHPLEESLNNEDFIVLNAGTDPGNLIEGVDRLIEIVQRVPVDTSQYQTRTRLDKSGEYEPLTYPDKPPILHVLDAAFSEVNLVANMAAAISDSIITDGPGSDIPWDPRESSDPMVQAYPKYFTSVKNEFEYLRTKERLEKRFEAHEILSRADPTLRLAASAIASVFDLPPFLAAKGSLAIARAAPVTRTQQLRLANLNLGTMALTEGSLMATNPVYSLDEATINFGLGALLLGFSMPLLPPAQRNAFHNASKKLDEQMSQRPVASKEIRDASSPGSQRPPSSDVGARGVSDAPAFRTEAEQLYATDIVPTGLKLEKLPENAYKRILNTKNIEARDLVSSLVENMGIYQRKHFQGETQGLSAETNIRQWQFPLAQASQAVTEAWMKSRDVVPSSPAGNVIKTSAMALKDIVANPSANMTRIEFNEQVAKAMRRGLQHPDPLVVEAATKVRELVYNPLAKAGQDAEVYTSFMRSEQYVIRTQIDEKVTDITVRKEKQASLERKINATEKLDTKTLQRLRKQRQQNFKLLTEDQKALRRLERKDKQLKLDIDKRNAEVDKFTALGNKSTYVNRVWRVDKIEHNLVDFQNIIEGWLLRKGVAEAKLEKEFMEILASIRQEKYFNPIEMQRVGIASAARQRALDIPDELVEDYIENDIDLLMKHYVNSFAVDVELARRFGTVDMIQDLTEIAKGYDTKIAALRVKGSEKQRTKLIKEKEQVISDLELLRDRLRGTAGMPDDPYRLTSRAIRVVKDWNYMTMLGGVSLSALPDVVRPIMVEGWSRTFRHAIQPLTTTIKALERSGAETRRANTGLDMVINQRAMQMADLSDMYGQTSKLERITKNMSNMFSFINLLHPWNATAKAVAGMVVQARILETVDAWMIGNISQIDMAKLAVSGIDKPMAQRIARQFYKYGDIDFSKEATLKEAYQNNPIPLKVMREEIEKARHSGSLFLPNTDMWDDAVALHHFRSALAQDVDRIIVTPGAADKPNWATTELGGLLAQFKGFSMAASGRVLQSGLQERQGHTVLGATMLVFMGLMVHELKRHIRGDTREEGTATKVTAAFERSGLLGYFPDVHNFIEVMSLNKVSIPALFNEGTPYAPSGRWIAGTVAGPTGSRLADIYTMFNGVLNGDYGRKEQAALHRAIVGQNLFYLQEGFWRL